MHINVFAQALGDVCCAGVIGVNQQYREFLATVAKDQVEIAYRAADNVGDADDNLVAAWVAMAIVDAFEMIDIDHQEAGLAGLPVAQADFPLDLRKHVRTIAEAGQRVCERRAYGLLVTQPISQWVDEQAEHVFEAHAFNFGERSGAVDQ